MFELLTSDTLSESSIDESKVPLLSFELDELLLELEELELELEELELDELLLEHILEHSINNTNKRILVVAYQNIANDFLKDHPDLSNRIIVVDDVNNDTILKGLNDIMNVATENNSESSFGMPLIIGIVIGIIVGLGCGVLIMKKKN